MEEITNFSKGRLGITKSESEKSEKLNSGNSENDISTK